MILKTEAIVLKAFDYRETSRIATFFTKDHGKVSGVLKGIRTDPRKFGSSLEKYTINDIVYYPSRNSDLHLVSQCDIKEFFQPVRQDLQKSMAASYVLELVNKIMPAEEHNPRIYRLMTDFLRGLEEAADVNQLVHMFQIKTLLYSGFRPHLDACLKCHKKIAGQARFSMKEGGLVCMDCPSGDQAEHFISKGSVASILHIEKNEWANCLKLKLSEGTKKELKYILNNFLIFHLGRNLRSAQYLA